mmetsp:Transcript_21059/g.40078  ORF Transcript_21059/g.40078 Transcript_21059/m.40078 type:complete len:221 (-) Transcript_21059:293-955(-)
MRILVRFDGEFGGEIVLRFWRKLARQEETHASGHNAQHKRHPPISVFHVVLGQPPLQKAHHAAGQEVSYRRRYCDECRHRAQDVLVLGLRQRDGEPRRLPPRAQADEHAAQHYKAERRRVVPVDEVRGDETLQHRARGDAEDGKHGGLVTTHHVPQPPKQQASNRAHHKGQGVGCPSPRGGVEEFFLQLVLQQPKRRGLVKLHHPPKQQRPDVFEQPPGA